MRGLFGRLGSGRRQIDEVASIIAHLHVLLNARHGMSSADPQYGLPDFTDLVHHWPDSARAMERSIRETIERYEPRLASVTVRQLGGTELLLLAFFVNGRLASQPSRAVRFRTELDAAGRFSVRG
jgi:type VI secretion system protein